MLPWFVIAALMQLGAGGQAAQRQVTVTTIPSGGLLAGPDGAVTARYGTVLVANWDGNKGTAVVALDPDGAAPPRVVVTGLASPDGLAYGPNGLLYISNFASGDIVRMRADGKLEVFARGLNAPSALAFDRHGVLYVSEFGNYDGTRVMRISRRGEVSVFATGFNVPLGLAFDPHGDLFVSNFGSGVVHRVTPDGTVHEFARVPNAPLARLQYLAFDDDGTLYVPSYGHHRVYAIARDGDVRVLAGDGTAGGTDGPGATARFDGPNSITRLRNGSLVVTEYNANRARLISFRR
jgi:sugar lactone lactonase YvrE